MEEATLDALRVPVPEVCNLVNKRKGKKSMMLLREGVLQSINLAAYVFRIDVNLERLVEYFRVNSTRTPLVDTYSGLVFMENSHHETWRHFLSDVYFFDREAEYISPLVRRDRWLVKGCGWYISSMHRFEIVTHENYRITDHDAPIFNQYEVLMMDYPFR